MAEETKPELKLKAQFNTDLETSKKFMDPIHAKMDIYYEQYRNRFIKDDDQMNISDLHAYVETVVPIITNNRTRAYVKAEDPEHIKHAEGLEFILDHTFDQNDWDYQAQRIVRMAEIYRSSIAYTGYDEKANNGIGKLTIKGINSRWCYLDPASIELEDSSFFFYIEPMRASKVKSMYPDKADEIGKNRDEHGNNEKQNGWFKSLLNTVKGYLKFGADTVLEELSEEEKRKNAVAFIHYWYRDDNDKWRVSYWADDVFLEDMENPFWHEQLPYDIYSPTEDILSVFGIPMAEQIEGLNYEKNVLLNMFVKNAKRAVDPTLLYNTTIGLDDPRALKRKADEDGIIGVKNPDNFPLDTIATFMPVPGVPNWASEIPRYFGEVQDGITGVNDSFRGMSEATSGKEVQLKQEAAYTRIKTKVDNFEKFVKNIARKTIINAMQFIDTDTQFRVKGDYRQFEGQEELPFNIEKIQTGENEEGPQFDRNEFFLYANPNEWTKIIGEDGEKSKEEVEEAYHVLNMIVEIEAGSSLPVSRQAKREETIELFAQGIVDQQYVLEQFDIVDSDEILQRMTEQLNQEKEREMQMAQIPNVPQGGLPPIPQGQPMAQDPMAQTPMPQGIPNQGGIDPQALQQFRQMLAQIGHEAAQLDDVALMQLLQEIQQGQPLATQQPIPQQAPPNGVV